MHSGLLFSYCVLGGPCLLFAADIHSHGFAALAVLWFHISTLTPVYGSPNSFYISPSHRKVCTLPTMYLSHCVQLSVSTLDCKSLKGVFLTKCLRNGSLEQTALLRSTPLYGSQALSFSSQGKKCFLGLRFNPFYSYFCLQLHFTLLQ